jgi:hypothetical protein
MEEFTAEVPERLVVVGGGLVVGCGVPEVGDEYILQQHLPLLSNKAQVLPRSACASCFACDAWLSWWR